MPRIKTKTTYLQMLTPVNNLGPPPRTDLSITRWDRPSVIDYRHLYRTVGEKYYWVNRLVMPDSELADILQDDRVDVFVLQLGDAPAGYSELDRRQSGEIELAYFGLFPQAIGQGLGKYFLNWTLCKAWSHRPRRVWVHTCDLDHAAALPNYLKAGFQVFDETIVEQEV